MQSPRLDHWDAVLRIVCYLNGHHGQGILLRANSPLILTAYCDSDWMSYSITHCSVTDYFVSIGGFPFY